MCSESKTYHIKVDSGYRLTYTAPTYSYSIHTLVPNHSVSFRIVLNLEHVVYICIKYFQVSVELY